MKKKDRLYDKQYHKKAYFSRFRINSIVMLAFIIVLLLTSGILFLNVSINPERYNLSILWPALIICYCLISISILLLYIFNIYLPSRRLYNAIRSVLDGDFDFILSEKGITEFSGLSEELNSFIASIRQIINNEYYTKILKKRAELNALQNQINPHFLYNTIDSIRGQALCEGSTNIANMAKALSSIFRYVVDNPNSTVTVQDELKHVKNYFTIQQYRFNNRFSLDISIEEGGIDIYSCKLPRLTIQPLVENAIIHGFSTISDRGSIKIRICATQSRLIITVEDDGIGIPPEKLSKINASLSMGVNRILDSDKEESNNSNIALVNVNERIRISYGDKYGVRIYSTYGIGTQSVLTLPIILE